jgi:hypothetical protein
VQIKRLSLIAVAVLAFTGCGGNGDAGGQQPAPDVTGGTPANQGTARGAGVEFDIHACNLVTQEELQQVLGDLLRNPPVPNESLDPDSRVARCWWNQGLLFEPPIIITVWQFDPDDQAFIKLTFRQDVVHEVAGLGDDAYVNSLDQLDVLVGTYSVRIDVPGTTANPGPARRLAELLIARLPRWLAHPQ